jgi:pimeloyl-ACP methyl ester carboxylesterase
MSKSAVVLCCGLIASIAGSPASALAQSADLVAVQSVIESAYVTGVFITRDSNAVRRGFHPRFVLSVLQSDTVLVVPLDAWLAQQRRLQHGIPGSRWTVLQHSAHLTFMEEPDRYREVLASFLDDVDAGSRGFASGHSSQP